MKTSNIKTKNNMNNTIEYTLQQEKLMIKSGIKLLKKNKLQIEWMHQYASAKESMSLMRKIVGNNFPNVRFIVRDTMVQQFIKKHFSI